MRLKVAISRTIAHSTEFEFEMDDCDESEGAFDRAIDKLITTKASPHWQLMSDEMEVLDIQEIPQRG